jgi:hypothetical protein
MYIYIYGTFDDARYALDGVKDILARGLSTDQFGVYVTQRGFDKYAATEAPAPALDENGEPIVDKDAKPFDPNGHLYWKKLQTLCPVHVIESSADAQGPVELQHVLDGATNYFKKDFIVIIVNQPMENIR